MDVDLANIRAWVICVLHGEKGCKEYGGYLRMHTVTCYNIMWYLIAFHTKMRLLVDLCILFLGVCIVILRLLALSWSLFN